MGALFGVLGHAGHDELAEMGRRLAHRGRAMKVIEAGPHCHLGVIADDPERCLFAGEDCAIACDAHVTNFRELTTTTTREAGLGTACQAAALLELWGSGGAKSIQRARGELAFAILESGRDGLVLGRDYFGFSPLYFAALRSGGIAFASEYKALLALRELKPSVDRDMLQYLQCTKKLPVGRTLFANVIAQAPGTVSRVYRDGRSEALAAAAPLEVEVTIHDEAQALEGLREELRDAVYRAACDIAPIGLALSGGIDSIGLAFLLRELFPDKEIHTYSAGFGPNDLELGTAARVAEQIRAIHHEVPTPTTLLDELRDVVWHLEDPCHRSEAVQFYAVGRVAARDVDTVLSGQGADSLLGGMPRYKLLRWMQRLAPLRVPLREFYGLTQYGREPRGVVGASLGRLYFGDRVPSVPAVRGAVQTPEISLPEFGPEFVNRCMARSFQHVQCQDSQKYERPFAAFGVGYRSPFADVGLARFAFALSDRLKIRWGVEKYVLRRALADVVPAEFLSRPKFPGIMAVDEAFSARLDELAAQVLSREAVEQRGWFSHAELRTLQRPGSQTPYSREGAMRLWTPLLTELWAQEFLDGRGRAPIDREVMTK